MKTTPPQAPANESAPAVLAESRAVPGVTGTLVLLFSSIVLALLFSPGPIPRPDAILNAIPIFILSYTAYRLGLRQGDEYRRAAQQRKLTTIEIGNQNRDGRWDKLSLPNGSSSLEPTSSPDVAD